MEEVLEQEFYTAQMTADEIIQEHPKDALELLVDLAKRGDLDPWDIDLESVTEKYLRELDNVPRENLKEAARGIFFASVLLRMKSELLESKVNETLHIGIEDDLVDDMLDEDIPRQISFRELETTLTRRSLRRLQRFRPLTLEDLIGALKGAEEEEERRDQRRIEREMMLDWEIVAPETSDDMLELTHAEDLEGAIERSRGFLLEYLVDGQGVEFNELRKFLRFWSDAFLSVLFLAHENEVELKQEKFYGELWIHEPEKTS